MQSQSPLPGRDCSIFVSEENTAVVTSESQEIAAKRYAGRTALVVDDSMLIRHTVCRFLEERSFHVETATNGVEALDALAKLTPDIIITDLSMPLMTGSELITEVKKRAALESTPIVVLSAKLKANTKPEEMRADFVVYKDIDIEEQLETALHSVFAR